MGKPIVPKLYWDTGVFICLLNKKSEPRRQAIAAHILHQAEEGKVTLCTSMFAIVEVLRPKDVKWPAPLTAEQVRDIEGMFKWKFLKKYQVDEPLALKAARLARETGLKPADAIHAATAIAAGADVLQRWDRDFGKVADRIRVEEPRYINAPLLEFAEEDPESL